MSSLTESTNKDAPTPSMEPQGVTARGFAFPLVDVFESPSDYLLQAELPGVQASEVEVEIHQETLSIRAPRADQAIDYRRRFRLKVPVDADAVSAKLEHGILELKIPKAESARPRTIKVS